jgi:hypothetical protein
MEGAMTERLRALAVLSILALATKAEAFPAFARKTGQSCTACHVGWPILNQHGTVFRDNGYQLGLEKDDPVTISSAYVPFAIRSTAGYEYTRTTNQPSDAGGVVPVTVSGGGVPAPGIDLLTGGVIAKDLSYLVVVAGFLADDEPANIESAWARVSNIGGTGWLNLRAGKFELDLPASSHRPATLTSGYAAYGAHPAGTAVEFAWNRVG